MTAGLYADLCAAPCINGYIALAPDGRAWYNLASCCHLIKRATKGNAGRECVWHMRPGANEEAAPGCVVFMDA